jgi:hypothetical protein
LEIKNYPIEITKQARVLANYLEERFRLNKN